MSKILLVEDDMEISTMLAALSIVNVESKDLM